MKVLVRLLVAFLLAACSTTSIAPKQSCYCGPLISDDATKSCGIWEKTTQFGERPEAMLAFEGPCTLNTCKLKAGESCLSMEAWPHKSVVDINKPAIDKPCYCDLVEIASDQGTTTVCAAWAPGESNLLEYFALERCNVETCRKKPFVLAASHCQLGFVSFYREDPTLPLQRNREN